ncbi:MAG: 3-phosphoshikimate 1-carboxyvinyltransferase [Desulfobacterales bacterium]|nr:3-phosphoshikimate 1-carboxyvinyltransferase [Desulfobacterales bacterium]
MKEIQPIQSPIQAEVTVPGSKSYTHRTFIAAALSNGDCTILNSLKSEDTEYTLHTLNQLGIHIEEKENHVFIRGGYGQFSECNNPIFLGNSGTSMRLLAGIGALGKGDYTFTGSPRLCERPIQDLLDALNQLGVSAYALHKNGCPPLIVSGKPLQGGSITLNCTKSSQYLSAMLLIAPCTQNGLEIQVQPGLVSKPYVDMTLDIMRCFGIQYERDRYDRFFVPGKQTYQAGTYTVEPDCSQAGYFWAAAAVTGGKVKVLGVTKNSKQGDVRLVEVFEKMGCNITHSSDGITVEGGQLKSIRVDMSDMPDMVPTLAVVSAFAKGTTTIENVAHLTVKESNRLDSVATELRKMGIHADATADAIQIEGGTPKGNVDIETYNDHRMAMCFAVAGLKVPHIRIQNPKCVQKSFPNFFEVFEGMYRS